MVLLKTKNNKRLFNFNNIKISLFLIILITFVIINNLSQTNILVTNNITNKYMVTLTYYYPGTDGSTNKTGSGKTTADFTVDSNGWYHYMHNGIDYLVVATATTYCKNSSNHCGISVDKHGIAQNIPYYNYFDTLVIKIGEKLYNAIVLDSCGACMWGNRDTEGEKIDVFVQNGSAVNPAIYETNIVGGSVSANNNSNFNSSLNIGTTYTGDIKNGYIYNRFIGKFEKWNNETKIINEINDAINEIYSRAFESTTTSSNIGTIITDPTGGDYSQWKQCNSPWSSVPIGSSGKNICQIGCLVTSVSIQIKRSETAVTMTDFNPGNFIKELNSKNAFDAGGNFYWRGWQQIAPNWTFAGKEKLPSSWEGKLSKISELLNQGYYPVMCVKKNCGHWVAVTGVANNNIIIIDPGSNATTVLPSYQNIANDSTLTVAKFKKTD